MCLTCTHHDDTNLEKFHKTINHGILNRKAKAFWKPNDRNGTISTCIISKFIAVTINIKLRLGGASSDYTKETNRKRNIATTILSG